MSKEDLRNTAIDSVLMEVYGLSSNQFYNSNIDYQRQLYNNFIKLLEENYAVDNNHKKVKNKVLNFFRKK